MPDAAHPNRSAIAAGQLEQLRTLLAELFPGNKFYTRKLNGVGITFDGAILDNEITVLCCTPTYALRLAETAAREKIPLDRSRVRTLIVAGEPGGSIPAVRAQLEELWPGARVFDHHGMTEVGPVTYQCPARPGVLHVIENAYYAEVIQPGGSEPAPPGQTGELVLTTLGRTGSPVLRYRTGDLVKCGVRPPPGSGVARSAESGMGNGPCACGRF